MRSTGGTQFVNDNARKVREPMQQTTLWAKLTVRHSVHPGKPRRLPDCFALPALPAVPTYRSGC